MAISPAELDALGQEASSLMLDRCQVLTWSGGAQDAYGIPASSYTPGPETPCSFRPGSARETEGGAQAPAETASLSLPLTVAVGPRDRIRVLARYGVSLDVPVDYEITELTRRMLSFRLSLAPPGRTGMVLGALVDLGDP